MFYTEGGGWFVGLQEAWAENGCSGGIDGGWWRLRMILFDGSKLMYSGLGCLWFCKVAGGGGWWIGCRGLMLLEINDDGSGCSREGVCGRRVVIRCGRARL